jgi:WD40 repeat protein
MPKSTLPIKEHTRPVDCAAWRFDEAGHLTIWTADSMGVIKEWEIEGGKLKYVKDWKGHETSISCLHVVEDGLWSGTSSGPSSHRYQADDQYRWTRMSFSIHSANRQNNI